MRIEAPPRIRRPLPLTPLVDIVFLLLMFFMLSSTFSKFGGIDLGRTTATAAQAPFAPVKSGVIINVMKQGKAKVNGEEVRLEALVTKLDLLHRRGARSAIVTLSNDAAVQDLVDVLERAKRTPLQPISLAK